MLEIYLEGVFRVTSKTIDELGFFILEKGIWTEGILKWDLIMMEIVFSCHQLQIIK
ncbi:hypothetical protein [Anaeropeptidivorans aminofermentans]|uniref:hypothetical protein n=1 Tax=Anaeropeptidivorans aminofermentans TaxID=2934315 RepID=UPI002024A51A|nr:hypothetical protein [Anaeropeptidivorans aminofermentans]